MKIIDKMLLGLSTIFLSISTFGIQVSLENTLDNNQFALRSVSSGNYLDGRGGEKEPLMTSRNPADVFLQWTLQRLNTQLGIFAIKSISSGNYLDGRGGAKEPLMTSRNPVDDKYLQWEFHQTEYW